MVKIRLARHGKTNDPFYKIVAIEEGKKQKGEPIEVLGHWHPASDDKEIDKKKIKEWVSKGAQVTKGVSKLL